MSFWQILIAFIIIYICVYIPIDRICRCVEYCAVAKTYSRFRENGISANMGDIEAGIEKAINDKNHWQDC